LLVSAVCASAQLIVSARAGLIDFSLGSVNLNGERLHPGNKLHQMQPGQTLSTGKGRVELLLAPGIMMRLGDDTAIRIEDTDLDDTRVVIEKGSAFIEVVEVERDSRLRVFLGESEVEFRRTGLYRFESAPARLRVYGGEAVVLRGGGQMAARRGQAIDLNALELCEWEPGPTDTLHSWSAQRSFTLFNTSADNRRRQKHWEYIGDGWVSNKNYGVRYRSSQARRDNSWVEQQLRRPPSVPRADSRE
jgi:hypothetical protein